MQKTAKVFSIVVSCLVLVLAGAMYFQPVDVEAQGQFVGFVNSDQILESYEPAMTVNANLAKLREQSEAELEAQVRQKFGSGDVGALPRESQLEIQKMIEQAEMAFEDKSEALREKEWIPIVDAVNAKIEEVSKEKNLQVVLEHTSVIFGGLDITQDVIDKLGK